LQTTERKQEELALIGSTVAESEIESVDQVDIKSIPDNSVTTEEELLEATRLSSTEVVLLPLNCPTANDDIGTSLHYRNRSSSSRSFFRCFCS
jgi:hypothetical protein